MPLRPLALGAVHVGTTSGAMRRRARIALAAHAHREGYALLDTVEVGTNDLRDQLAADALVALATRNRITTVFTLGAVNQLRLRDAGLPASVILQAVPGAPGGSPPER